MSTDSDLHEYRTLRVVVDGGVATVTLHRTFDGHRAVELGLGSRVLPADEVLPAALELAHDIATNTAPMSVAASKRLLWDSLELDRKAVGARETEIHLRLMTHDDAREGVLAYVERRDPRWTGSPQDPTN